MVYVKNTSVTVEYFDQTTGKVLKTDTLTGLMGGDLNYTTTSTIQGYVATVSTVTPTDPTQNTKVTYVKKDAARTVLFLDKTTGTTLATVNVDGKYGDQIKFSPAKLIQSFEQKGYHLIVNEFGQAGTTLGDANNGKTYLIEFEHQTKTITPSDPGQPGQPINPNDPNGPKWPAGTGASDLVKDATQTIHYQGVSGVEDSVTTIKGAFEKTVTVDLVTGKIVSETDFTGQANFETVKTPVVNGYHADRALAGGLTATHTGPAKRQRHGDLPSQR